MAETSVEEIRRLARNFLVGKGGPGDLADLKRDMESDPQLPFELLQLMQTALDEVPPAGFSPDQWKELDARYASMTNPLLRSGFGKLGQIFSSLFKKGAKAEAPAASPPGLTAPLPSAPGLSAPAAPLPAVEIMEDMAPIEMAESELAPPLPPKIFPVAPAPEPVQALEFERPAKRSTPWVAVGLSLLAVVALGFAGYSGFLYWKWRKPVVKTEPLKVPAALPGPQASRKTGIPNRARPASDLDKTLPTELAPQTLQKGDPEIKPDNLEAKDQAGNRGFPLP